MKINDKFRIYSDIFNAEGMTDENQLANALLTQPHILSPIITHLVGRESDRFPLSFITEGMNRVEEINGIEYEYPVIGRMDKAEAIAEDYSGPSNPGIGFTEFKVKFATNWLKRQYVIRSPKGVMARVQEDPIRSGNSWEYTLQLTSPSKDYFCPASELKAGQKWVSMFAPVAQSRSRGNESPWMAPSQAKNQITVVRKSYKIAGNVSNKTVNIELPVGDGKSSTKLWMPFEEFQHMLSWKQECELLYWYSEYNRDKNGEIHLKDDNGLPIPLGGGVLEQIPNKDTYSFLTEAKLKSVVTDALFGSSDADAKDITLYTGTGGMREFDAAMKSASSGFTVVDTKQIQGSGANMMYGSYFTAYRHIDGHMIKVKYLPLFDKGRTAMNSPIHPIDGLPLESYRMVFLDQSTYDGQANIKMLTEKGRSMVRRVVRGMADLPASFGANAESIASDVDESSVQFLKSSGIQIMRASNCLDLQCTIS